MNKGRWAPVRLVARRSVCSAVDVSVIWCPCPRAINRLNLRPAFKAGLLVERTVRKNRTAWRERRGFRPKSAERRPVLQGVGHMGGREYRSNLAVRPVEGPRTLRDYSSGSPEFGG